jgi:hypothetical protein
MRKVKKEMMNRREILENQGQIKVQLFDKISKVSNPYLFFLFIKERRERTCNIRIKKKKSLETLCCQWL